MDYAERVLNRELNVLAVEYNRIISTGRHPYTKELQRALAKALNDMKSIKTAIKLIKNRSILD